MSLENKSTVRRFYDEVLNQGHLHVLDEICAPDFVDHTPAQGHSGDRANMKQQITAWRQAFPDLRVTVEEMIAEAHTIVVRITWEGTHQGPFMGVPATGKRITSSAVDILHVKEGRVAEGWHYGGDDLRQQLTQ